MEFGDWGLGPILQSPIFNKIIDKIIQSLLNLNYKIKINFNMQQNNKKTIFLSIILFT